MRPASLQTGLRLISTFSNNCKRLASRMATKASQDPCTEAPWRAPFLKHISSLKTPTFGLSTLHPTPSIDQLKSTPPLSAHIPAVPRARTCIYRGLWASGLPPNPHNTAPKNPAVYESDLPVFTTDARTEKAAEILDTSGTVSAGMTGGGGPVEAVWWAEEFGTQWRLRGTAWVLGPDVEGEHGKLAREVIGAKMRRTGQEGEFSWTREITAHFGNLSPIMRGTFRSPPPGTPVAVPPEEGLGVGMEVHDLEDPVARKNFRVVVIVPVEVDQVDLSDQKKPGRWLYTYRGKSWKAKMAGGMVIGEWERAEVWP